MEGFFYSSFFAGSGGDGGTGGFGGNGGNSNAGSSTFCNSLGFSRIIAGSGGVGGEGGSLIWANVAAEKISIPITRQMFNRFIIKIFNGMLIIKKSINVLLPIMI